MKGVPRRARPPAETITVTATSVQTVAARQPLRWPAVVPSAACDQNAFLFNWRRVQFVFRDLPDPRTFPPYPPGTVPAADVAVLRRFRQQAVHLAESRVVNDGASMEVRFPDGPNSGDPNVDYTFPAQDLIAGFSVGFRQCYSPDEPASFAKTTGVLWRATKTAPDGRHDQRAEHLRAWARAQGQLRAYNLMTLCSRALHGGDTGNPLVEERQGEPPEFVISAFNYGADIHWGDKKDTVAAWNNDTFLGPHQRMQYFETAGTLAFIYLGLSELIQTAVPD